MHLHVLGASGSGTSTLGKDLAEALGFHFLDIDAFYWLPTEPPFTHKRDPLLRNQLLAETLASYTDTVVSGSLVSWGESWKQAFDAVIFLWIPKEVRLARLRNREWERYGNVIFDDPERHSAYLAFLEWAQGYDETGYPGRSRANHEAWIASADLPTLRLEGDFTRTERVDRAELWLRSLPFFPAPKNS